MQQQTEKSDFDGAAVDDEEMELLSVTLAASRYQMSCDNVIISMSARSAPKPCAASLALADLSLSESPPASRRLVEESHRKMRGSGHNLPSSSRVAQYKAICLEALQITLLSWSTVIIILEQVMRTQSWLSWR